MGRRIGVYSARHVQRLELIARLQHRGYSLAGIKDLLGAWDAGTDLTTLLGIEPGPALDEIPLRITRRELSARLSGLTAATLRGAIGAGLLRPDGAGQFLVRSPALLGLVADGVRAGVPVTDMLELIAALTSELDTLAQRLADVIVDRIWPHLAESGTHEPSRVLQRGRILLLQSAPSVPADRLAAALLTRAGAVGADALTAAIDGIRIGAFTDAAGNIHRQADARPASG